MSPFEVFGELRVPRFVGHREDEQRAGDDDERSERDRVAEQTLAASTRTRGRAASPRGGEPDERRGDDDRATRQPQVPGCI